MLRMLPLKLTWCVSSLGRVIDSLLVRSQSLMTVKFTSLFNCFQNNMIKDVSIIFCNKKSYFLIFLKVTNLLLKRRPREGML